MAQYVKRVSISPKRSPAKTPEGCWRESMTDWGVRGDAGKRGSAGRTFDDTVNVEFVYRVELEQDLYPTEG